MVLDLVDENNWWKYKKCDNSGFDSNKKKDSVMNSSTFQFESF